MSGVVEEKANRVIEVLITSIAPIQLLLGKIIGLGALGLTQMLIWLLVGGVLLVAGQNAASLQGVVLSAELVLISLVYFLLTYFLFAGLMAGIGASAGSEQESRQYASIFALLIIVPIFFIGTLITDSENPVITVLTLIPFTAPLTVILRLSLDSVPAWQLVASLSILLVSTILVVWGMARVFRWSLLLYGKRPTPRQLWNVIRGSTPTRIGTVATSTEQTA
jgi:ABC-2 type transport system permease protein